MPDARQLPVVGIWREKGGGPVEGLRKSRSGRPLQKNLYFNRYIYASAVRRSVR
jgi:hypothetical protein